jgi:hypothetical protein
MKKAAMQHRPGWSFRGMIVGVVAGLLFLFSGCSGGFSRDSANADKLVAPLFESPADTVTDLSALVH